MTPDLIKAEDIVDYEGYEDVIDRCLLKAAPDYLELIKAEFAPRDSHQRIEMFSTKLRGRLEFRPGEVTVWAGYNGHRKSMFTGQVAMDLVAQKRRVMVASFEMAPQATLARMSRQALAKAVPKHAELEEFVSWTRGKLWMFDHVGRIAPSKILAMCRYFADAKMGHHVFIDSMMMVCRSEEHSDEQKQLITDLVRLAQETKLHIHLVCHCRKPQAGDDRPPSKYDVRGSAAITDQVANVVTVWCDKAKKAKQEQGYDPSLTSVPDAMVTVEKQRNGKWEGRCNLWFDDATLRFCDDASRPVEPYAGVTA